MLVICNVEVPLLTIVIVRFAAVPRATSPKFKLPLTEIILVAFAICAENARNKSALNMVMREANFFAIKGRFEIIGGETAGYTPRISEIPRVGTCTGTVGRLNVQ